MIKKENKRRRVLTSKKNSDKMREQSPVLRRKSIAGHFFAEKNDKRIILVDGENFVHKIEEVLKEKKLIRRRSQIKRLDLKKIFAWGQGAEMNYYATTVKMPKKEHMLHKKMDEIQKWNSAWVPQLIFQGVNYVRAGYLRIRDGKTCQKCASQAEVLIEKGVDVRLAVDLVSRAKKGAEIFVVSSDTDLLPAIEVARKKGAKVSYVAFEDKDVKLISKKATGTILIKDAQVMKAFKEANK